MPSPVAGALVFVTSAAVLAMEILAARLLAPYVGVTLETYTGIIATVLAGIAAGAWLGGRVADRLHPGRLIGPAIAAGGVLTLLSVPIIRYSGGFVSGSRMGVTIALTIVGFFAPALVLSAVPPMVIKLQLGDLDRTGRVAGWLSALSTVGAIAGTLLTGYVFIAAFPIRLTLLAIGGALVVLGVALWLLIGSAGAKEASATLAVVVLATLLAAVTPTGCDRETKYYCARLEPAGAFTALILDDLVHSFVDPDDPRNLRGYLRTIGDVADTLYADLSEISAIHIGGGGFTFPRYVASTWPGSRNRVFEIDPGVTQFGRDFLGLRTGDGVRVTTEDARVAMRTAETDSADLVVGDAFGGLAVPWHLTTVEFVRDIQRVLRPDGAYLVNVIDFPPLGFLRAEVTTLRAVFDHVAVVATPEKFGGTDGGNFVVVASDTPLDVSGIDRRLRARGAEERAYPPASLEGFVGDASRLTDDHAPVDQLLTPSAPRP